MSAFVPARRDLENEQPIPTEWRSVIREVVSCLVTGERTRLTQIVSVEPVELSTFEHIADYLAD